MDSTDHPMTVFINRLKMIADLPAEVSDALASVAAAIKTFGAGQNIVYQGDRPSHCAVILEGWVCRNKVLANGKRQITALHFAGVAPDLQSLFLPVMDHNITTLTRVRAAFIPHATLRELMERFPALAKALWQETVLDAAISREWEVNLAARQAGQRIAHVLCETAVRLDRFGWARRNGNSLSFEWPLNQTEFGQVTGLSTVHVNRSLQALRASKLIYLQDRSMIIYDLPKLETFAEFNPDYLLAEQPRTARQDFVIEQGLDDRR